VLVNNSHEINEEKNWQEKRVQVSFPCITMSEMLLENNGRREVIIEAICMFRLVLKVIKNLELELTQKALRCMNPSCQ
jgi:hypothetical protein